MLLRRMQTEDYKPDSIEVLIIRDILTKMPGNWTKMPGNWAVFADTEVSHA